jgi:hypothetical protein
MSVRHALLGLLISGIAALPAGAVDKAVFKCESQAAAAVNKWGGSRGKCLVKCDQGLLKGDARDCVPPGFDAATLACMAAADDKYTATVLKVCPTLPTCGSYSGETPASYAAGQIAAQSAQIDPITVPVLLCDDALFKCGSKVVASLAKLSGSLGKCFSKCYGALQLKGDATKQCTPDATGDPFDTLDATTAGCISAAVGKASAGITKACPALPACGLYPLGLPALLNLVTGALGGNYADPASNPYCAP